MCSADWSKDIRLSWSRLRSALSSQRLQERTPPRPRPLTPTVEMDIVGAYYYVVSSEWSRHNANRSHLIIAVAAVVFVVTLSAMKCTAKCGWRSVQSRRSTAKFNQTVKRPVKRVSSPQTVAGSSRSRMFSFKRSAQLITMRIDQEDHLSQRLTTTPCLLVARSRV